MADHEDLETRANEAFAAWRREDPLSALKIERLDRSVRVEDQHHLYKGEEYRDEFHSELGALPKVEAAKSRMRKSRHRTPVTVLETTFATAYQWRRWGDLQYLHVDDLYQAFDAQAVILWTALEEFYLRTGRASLSQTDILRELGRLQLRMGPQTKVLFLSSERGDAREEAKFEALGFHAGALGAIHPRHGGSLVIPGVTGPGRGFDPLAVPAAKDGARGRADRAIGNLFGRSRGWVRDACSRFAAVNRGVFPFSMKVRRAELTFMWVDRPERYLHVAFPAATPQESRIERIWAEDEPLAFGWGNAVTPTKDTVISQESCRDH